jgi:L-rhamnose isomerase/sugar isomerase
LKSAFATDVREALAAWREARGFPRDPLAAHRSSGYTARAAHARLPRKQASGGSYA